MRSADKFFTSVNPSDREQIVAAENDAIPSKEDILDDIRAGYVYVMSGGVGQPIDDVHREIAEELAHEELAENADIRP